MSCQGLPFDGGPLVAAKRCLQQCLDVLLGHPIRLWHVEINGQIQADGCQNRLACWLGHLYLVFVKVLSEGFFRFLSWRQSQLLQSARRRTSSSRSLRLLRRGWFCAIGRLSVPFLVSFLPLVGSTRRILLRRRHRYTMNETESCFRSACSENLRDIGGERDFCLNRRH